MKNRTSKIKRRAIIIVGTSVFILFIAFSIFPFILSFKIANDINEAFETLDNKLEDSRVLINQGNNDVYRQFEQKKVAFKVLGRDVSLLEFWENKALHTKSESAKIIGYILNDANEMIKLAEKKDWVMNRDADGNILSLLPLNELSKMDDYETPTLYFLGKSADKFKPDPNAAGVKLVNAIHAFRDKVTEEMGTYQLDGKEYVFKAPSFSSDLQAAFETCNDADTAKIGEVYRLLTYPEKEKEKYSDSDEEIPYVSLMFYQAPIVAACAMLTSLTVDVRIVEKMVAEFYLSKLVD